MGSVVAVAQVVGNTILQLAPYHPGPVKIGIDRVRTGEKRLLLPRELGRVLAC